MCFELVVVIEVVVRKAHTSSLLRRREVFSHSSDIHVRPRVTCFAIRYRVYTAGNRSASRRSTGHRLRQFQSVLVFHFLSRKQLEEKRGRKVKQRPLVRADCKTAYQYGIAVIFMLNFKRSKESKLPQAPLCNGKQSRIAGKAAAQPA
jgi:hypothetical protein